VRLGDELLAAIDARADRMGYSRAEVIRMLLADAVQSEMGA
jgi:metal-responsive CopG/Arc/MetJ family transcriptional regulator